MKKAVVFCINLYQKIFSPDHGTMRIFFPYGVCRFYPTCSEYTKMSIEKEGALKGIVTGLKQLLQCHPFGGLRVKIKSEKINF